MEIIVNKKPTTVPEDFKMGDLLKHLKYTRSVAIFVNGKQLLSAEYEDFKINNNDNIRIIRPLGGG